MAGIYAKDFDEVFSKEVSLNKERLTVPRSALPFGVKISGKAPVMHDNAVSPALHGGKFRIRLTRLKIVIFS